MNAIFEGGPNDGITLTVADQYPPVEIITSDTMPERGTDYSGFDDCHSLSMKGSPKDQGHLYKTTESYFVANRHFTLIYSYAGPVGNPEGHMNIHGDGYIG